MKSALWLMGIVAAIILPVFGWLCQRSISHDAQIAAVQYQIQAMIVAQTNVIPPVIEGALRELRDKGNKDRDELTSLMSAMTANTKDISYLREQALKK